MFRPFTHTAMITVEHVYLRLVAHCQPILSETMLAFGNKWDNKDNIFLNGLQTRNVYYVSRLTAKQKYGFDNRIGSRLQKKNVIF